jgi:hypothetical protein
LTRELGPDDTAPFHFDDDALSIGSSRAESKSTVEVDLASLESIPSLRSSTELLPSPAHRDYPATPSPPNEGGLLDDDTMISSAGRPAIHEDRERVAFKTPARAFSPTPMNEGSPDASSSYSASRYGDASTEEGVQQRQRRGRRPLSAYPTGQDDNKPCMPPRKYTDPTPRTHHYEEEHVAYDSAAFHQINLDAYPHDFDDDGRAPTLSFVTTSTADSTASTPSLSASYGGYRPDPMDNYKPDVEPRIRMRAPIGRTNAYSSAESSGAYSAYGYDHSFANAPPLPVTNIFTPAVQSAGLGFSGDMVPSPVSAGSSEPRPITPSYEHRPWQSDLAGRKRADSVSSSEASLDPATDSEVLRPGADIEDLEYRFDRYDLSGAMPWEEEQRREARAVRTVDEGQERIFDRARLEALGGVKGLTPAVLDSLHGE